jgi:hypothetical protein
MKKSFPLIIAVMFLCLTSWTGNKQSTISEKGINRGDCPIYRLAVGDTFALKIDDEFIYHNDSRVLGVPPMGYKIGSIKRQEGKQSTISLQVDGHDTLFQMPLYKYDSVMFGYLFGRGFLVETSFSANDWGKD